MSKILTAAVLSLGSELVSGKVRDVHGGYISRLLTESGIEVKKILQMSDEYSVFEELRGLSSIADIVLVTGGLGPTSDDLTREIIAKAADVPLDFNDAVWSDLVRRFSGRISPTNKKQAYVPFGFSIIHNPCGTAPGLKGKIGEAVIYALPGPPSELNEMFHNSVLPEIREIAGVSAEEKLSGTAFLISESLLEEILQKNSSADVTWSTRANPFRILFSLNGGTSIERETLFGKIEEFFTRIRIKRGEVAVNQQLLETLARSGTTAAFAESCTGGLCGKLLTDISGSSEVFWGSLVTYADDAKISLLGVSSDLVKEKGAVSGECVSAMADGLLKKTGAGIAAAVSGIAGPEGGKPGKPVGTVWIAVKGKNDMNFLQKFVFTGNRDRIRRKTAVAVFLLIENYIVDREGLDSIVNWQYI